MNLLFEVDMNLGDEPMTKYNCILHYGRKCLMIQKGKRHISVKTQPMHRDPPEDSDAVPNVLSASQLKRAVRRGERVFLASVKLLEPVTAALASTSPSVEPDHPESEKPWVSDLIGEFSKVFQDPLPDGLPPMRKEVHSIPQSQDIRLRFGRCTVYLRWSTESWRNRSRLFLRLGFWKCPRPPYGAPVLFVPKPIKNRCTIPRIDDLLDAVSGLKYFTSLDQTSGYHQMLISKEDRPKTAFCTPFGHFQFKVLIEGLTNAPATFQTAMNSIFHPYLQKFVVVYLDDILIYSWTEKEHKAHVCLGLDVLKREKFYVWKTKSTFAAEEIEFLGHIVNSEGIRPDFKNVEVV
jgi:hypothetical protein